METRRGRGRGPTDREHLGPLPSRTLWLRARPCSRKPLGYNWRIPRSPSTDSLRRPWGERPTFGPRKSTDGRQRERGREREEGGDKKFARSSSHSSFPSFPLYGGCPVPPSLCPFSLPRLSPLTRGEEELICRVFLAELCFYGPHLSTSSSSCFLDWYGCGHHDSSCVHFSFVFASSVLKEWVTW